MATLTGIFHLIMAFFVALPQILAPIPAMLNENAYFEEWSEDQAYTEDYAVVLEKEEGEDFVVLNLADIQISDDENFYSEYEFAKNMITKLVEEQQPDLITLSGDNAWDTVSYIELVNFIDSLNIPWAPVMGNHDGQGCFNEFWCAYLFSQAENCLWKFGPEGMGYGNYIINIEENGEVIHTLFMMDTHDNVDYIDENGNHIEGYDHLWDDQIEWYEWAVNGIAAEAGKTVESSIIMHIPVFEMKTAWESSYDSENDCFTGEYADGSFGVIHETPCPGAINNHFMDTMLELDSTKNVIFGHDHVCNASVVHEGIRLTYSLKLGYGCYYEDGIMGGTTLTIASDGTAVAEHHYCA